MSIKSETPLAIAIAAALLGSITIGDLAHANGVFQLTDLRTGYMVGALSGVGDDAVKEKDLGADKSNGAQGSCGVARLDTDQDGKASRAEFDAANAETFAGLDTNQDGSVDQDEMNGALKARAPKGEEGFCGADKGKGKEGKCGEGKCGEGKCGVALMDANKDGKMTKAEYIAGHVPMFDYVDTNKDGFTTQDEENAANAAE